MNTRLTNVTLTLTAGALLVLGIASSRSEEPNVEAQTNALTSHDQIVLRNADRMLERGRRIFRYDTFGDEGFWGDTLKLHLAISGDALGGIGPGLSPRTALAVGLKVDRDALSPQVRAALKRREVDLDNPATTLALLKMQAVVGVTGHFD
jgi:hypothetical protein